ncbi:ABC transporter ATP-binding protein [Chitinasiproducens palmae]|uniref:Peptide/nickel transport system ATP-binding protein n=1 Tax=Chitinasiproducens palmae TaxID=1770053 RepID=A0A1H2PKL3_9BURK|nr:ABC transporter ATP-binding protein [Chitinasiproducens palmae]SDV46497.1 peptide/nickel transport system ATP-binding protein [Chitinasiproducens palmae]
MNHASHPATVLLDVQSLQVRFGATAAPAVDGLSFAVGRGETVALVGESGCGKSTAALALMGLLPRYEASVSADALTLDGEDLRRASERRLCQLRGGEIAMIFQDPLSALNPVRTVGRQITEALGLHRGLRGRAARAEAVGLLRQVQIPEPERRLDEYPHRLSGGMRQRVLIAMALAGRPRLLVADEPTTALDVTIQAQILALLKDLQRTTEMAILLITHDLGVVAGMADRVVVMYAGGAVESRATADLLHAPAHPYTAKLLQARPRGQSRARLAEIPGAVPAPGAVPTGCRYAPRCEFAHDACRQALPAAEPVGDGFVRCLEWRAVSRERTDSEAHRHVA